MVLLQAIISLSLRPNRPNIQKTTHEPTGRRRHLQCVLIDSLVVIGIQLRLKCIARRRVAMTINNNHNAKKSSDKHLNYYKHSNWRTDGGQSHMAHIDLCWLDTIMLNPTNHNWSITLCWIFEGLCYFDLYIHSGILKISRQVSQYWKGRTSCHELMWQLTVISHIRLHCLIILKSDSSSKRITYIQCSENHTA